MKHDSFGTTAQPAQAAYFSPDDEAETCRVSIVIKALNEEKNIAATLESALRAVATVGGEVILADSCSSDATLAIASRYPIRIVQLAHPHERSCGAGPQLGFQHARGEFIYILDGDMRMHEGFLAQALSFFRGHPEVGGVGGHVHEKNLDSLEYLARQEHLLQEQSSGLINRLDGGGLYRRSAIESTGYFSDRNLHSYEEFDLAIRLRVEGWHLWRMPIIAADHCGHDAPPYQLLMRRWRTGYLFGLGELLRSALGKPRLRLVLQEVRELWLYAAVLGWWSLLALLLLGPGSLAWRLGATALTLLAPVALMSWRKRSWRRGVYAVVSWCFYAAGTLRGLLQRPAASRKTIDSELVQEAAFMPAPPEPGTHAPASLGHDSPRSTAPEQATVSAISQAVTESLLPDPDASPSAHPLLPSLSLSLSKTALPPALPSPASCAPNPSLLARSSLTPPAAAPAGVATTPASDAAWQSLLSRLERP